MKHIDHELLVKYCDNELSDKLTLWAIRQHLRHCEECSDKEQFLMELNGELREQGLDPCDPTDW